MRYSRKHKILRVIGITAAALITGAGAVLLFLKRRTIRRFFIFTVIISVMTIPLTAYAVPEQEPEPDDIIIEIDSETEITENEEPAEDTEPETDEVIDTETAEIIADEEIEIDIIDFISSDNQPQQLTPPGNLTLVDDFSGAQSDDKQFITVTTKSGNYFYIIIDRAGDNANVHFLNQVSEADLFALLEGEQPAPPATATPTEDKTPEQSPASVEPTPKPKNNTMGLIVMLAVIAAVGGGAYYFFKVRKPKQGGNKNVAVLPELDEFEFDPDENELFGGGTDGQDGENLIDDDMPDFTVTYDSDEGDFISIDTNDPDSAAHDEDDGGGNSEEIPDFTAANEPDNDDSFSFNFGNIGAETPESEADE